MKLFRSCATVGLAEAAVAAAPVVLAAVVPVAAVVGAGPAVACDPTVCCSDCSILPSSPCEAPTGIWPTLPMLDTLWDVISEPFLPCPRPCGWKLTVGSALDAALALVINDMGVSLI